MNDTPTFSPFATQTPPPVPMFEGETATPGKKTRKKRSAKSDKVTRKPRHNIAEQVKKLGADNLLPAHGNTPTKRKARVTRAPKFELGALQAFAGLKAEDAKLLANLVAGLSTVNKKSRAKIVAALAKVFA